MLALLLGLVYLHIYTSCTNQYGIYILQCSCKCSMTMYVAPRNGNDTHCRLFSLWIIPARRPATMLKVQDWNTLIEQSPTLIEQLCKHACMNNIYICTLQHTLAYKLTYSRCDMHMFCILYDYCFISLFAETVLSVGQVPMLVLHKRMISHATSKAPTCYCWNPARLVCEDGLVKTDYLELSIAYLKLTYLFHFSKSKLN